MRLSILLLALVAVLGASGCLFDDCGSPFPPPRSFSGVEVVADAAPAPDTLTVAFVSPENGFPSVTVQPLRDLPFETGGSRLRLRVDARVLVYGTAAPRFDTVVRGDTVFVRLQDINDPMRLVCSPPEPSLDLTVTRLQVPAGVRAVRVIRLDPYDPTVPTAQPTSGPRLALLTA